MQTQLSRLLTCLGVPHTRAYLAELSAYDDGSISFLKYVLSAYRIESLAVDLSDEQLDEIPLPAFVLLDEGNTHWAVLEKKEGDVLHLFGGGKTKKITQADFCRRWTGKTLLIEKNKDSGEPRFIENRSKERRLNRAISFKNTMLFALVFLLFVCVLGSQGENYAGIALFFLSCVAWVFSALLLLGEKDDNNDLFRKACALSSNQSCSKTVKNKKAFLASSYTWAEAAYAYFSFFVLCFCFAPTGFVANAIYQILQLTAFAGALTGFYSLYVQKFEEKTWCVLCLGVVAVLFLSVLPFFFHESFFSVKISISVLLPMFLSAFVVYFSLFAIRHYFSEKKKTEYEHTRLAAFLHDEAAFFSALMRNSKVSEANVPDDFVFGKQEAALKIVMVSRPSCIPCQLAHYKLNEMLQTFDSVISLKICYAFPPEKDHPDQVYVEKKLREQGLNTPQTVYSLAKHSDFCHIAGITQTPTFFVNGYEMPAAYRLEDLPYFAINV
jgi:hypothetical protein